MILEGLFLFFIGAALGAHSAVIDIKLNSILSKGERANVVVSFGGDTDVVLEKANKIVFPSRGAKSSFIKQELELLASSSQKSAVKALTATATAPRFHSSWISNRLYIESATTEIVEVLAGLPGVTEVRQEIVATISVPIPAKSGKIDGEWEWGVAKVDAPAVWASGVNGSGAVVAIVDTGVRANHSRLRENKRSNYTWFDPFRNSKSPIDRQGHGTHVAGIIVGAGGIGVAPGAEWIACGGCDEYGDCPESILIRCAEWVACPTLPDGSAPDCEQVADVVSNSWGYWENEITFYDEVISVYTAIGVIPVFSAGNRGNCQTISYPGRHKDVIGVGSINVNDTLANSSSRGPGENNILKPQISAPGVDIVSASRENDDALTTMSGTSMAAPHISGVVLLLRSKHQNLTFAQITNLIYSTAQIDLPLVDICGDTPPTQWPNNMYGHGIVNALRAVNAAPSN